MNRAHNLIRYPTNNKTFIALLLITAILISSIVVVQFGTAKAQNPKTITVPDDYPTIQAAVSNASSGDTVYVKNGVYREKIVVAIPLSLIGEDRQTTIIDGKGTGIVIQINSNNVEVANFTIRNAGASPWFGQGFPDSVLM